MFQFGQFLEDKSLSMSSSTQREFTLRILISFSSKLWDLANCFFVICLIATCWSGYFERETSAVRNSERRDSMTYESRMAKKDNSKSTMTNQIPFAILIITNGFRHCSVVSCECAFKSSIGINQVLRRLETESVLMKFTNGKKRWCNRGARCICVHVSFSFLSLSLSRRRSTFINDLYVGSYCAVFRERAHAWTEDIANALRSVSSWVHVVAWRMGERERARERKKKRHRMTTTSIRSFSRLQRIIITKHGVSNRSKTDGMRTSCYITRGRNALWGIENSMKGLSRAMFPSLLVVFSHSLMIGC